MGVRANILTNTAARDQYIQGCLLLKREFLGPTTRDFGIAGASTPVSTWDLFVIWHHVAMTTFTPASQTDRNAAHRGPVFLPWHRWMMVLLEFQFQRLLGDPNFGIPYWDWAEPGSEAGIFAADCMGGSGTPISTGAFRPSAANPFLVRVVANSAGTLTQANRGLRRQTGSAPSLPTKTQTGALLTPALSAYDAAPWNTSSAGLRNRLEGWLPADPFSNMHNRVHVWVAGDMGPSTSPNDPVFYLNHCNVDRLWEAWMQTNGRNYQPATGPASLNRHRLNDQMFALISAPVRVSQMLDPTPFYTYDSLAV